MNKPVKNLGEINRGFSKNEIIELANQNALDVKGSKQYDILKVYVELKRYQTYLDQLIKNLQPDALLQVAESGKKQLEYNQAKVQITKRTIWDFSIDEPWKDLHAEFEYLKNALKTREKELKEAHEKGVLLDVATGELIEGFQVPIQTKEGINVSL